MTGASVPTSPLSKLIKEGRPMDMVVWTSNCCTDSGIHLQPSSAVSTREESKALPANLAGYADVNQE